MVVLVLRKAQRGSILFGLLAMCVLRVSSESQPVDLVHLVGGGQLLLPSAMYHVAFVALCLRIMENERWRTTMVSATTILCAIYFGMQINRDFAWRSASQTVQRFQQEAAAQASEKPLLVCPDYQFYKGAPLCLSDAISQDTLFSKALPCQAAAPMHYFPANEMQVSFHPTPWPDEGGEIAIKGKRPIDVACWPYASASLNEPEKRPRDTVELIKQSGSGFALRVRLEPPIAAPYALLPGGQDLPAE